MHAFDDEAGEVGDHNSERMSLRTTSRVRRTIQRAAALSGVTPTVFMIDAAYKSAMETIAAHERTEFARVDHAAFFAALDNPPRPTDRLRGAFDRYRETISGK